MDRTKNAVRRQLTAMACSLFDLGLRHEHTGRMLQRSCCASQLLTLLPWLKYMNAHAHHIYIRPDKKAKPHGLVLVDDLCEQALDRLRLQGLAPALVVQTSPRSHQAWLRFLPPPSDRLRTVLARILAVRYHGDINSAHCHHYGRLAGFTNPKPCHRSPAGAPWTLLRDSSALPVREGAKLIREAQRLANRQSQRRPQRRLPAQGTAPQPYEYAVHIFQRHLARLRHHYGSDLDLSRVDWVAACGLARVGYSTDVIAHIIIQFSPHIATRKKRHKVDYATRTANKALRFLTDDPTHLRHLRQSPCRRRRPFYPPKGGV